MKNIIRVKKETSYVVIDKAFLNDKRLSWKAKGILSFMLSKPDDWTFYQQELMKHSPDGKTAFNGGFKELRDCGYVEKVRKRLDNGQFEYETIVHERPYTDFPSTDKPSTDNRTLLNNNTLSNEELSNDKHIYTIFSFWNEQKIIKHREMNQAMKSHINARLQNYSVDELKKAISNYASILENDKYYWTHKWSLQDFMKPNNVSRFVDDADPFNNFLKTNRGKQKNRKVVDF